MACPIDAIMVSIIPGSFTILILNVRSIGLDGDLKPSPAEGLILLNESVNVSLDFSPRSTVQHHSYMLFLHGRIAK